MQVPDMQEFYQPHEEGVDENTIVNQVKCELTIAVRDVIANPPVAQTREGKVNLNWFKGWGAKVSLLVTVNEKGQIMPGLTYSSPFEKATQTFSLALGANGSTQATREEHIEFTYSFAELLSQKVFLAIDPATNDYAVKSCPNEDGVLMHSDLKIADFITGKMKLATIPGTIPLNSGTPFSTLTYQVKFVVAYGANVTPSWKLVRFAANPSGSFLGVTRDKTHQLLITFAPTKSDATPTQHAQISAEGDAAHNAALIGATIESAIDRSRQ